MVTIAQALEAHMLTLNSSECKHKYRRARGDGQSPPLDLVSEPEISSAISSTAISWLDSMTNGEISAEVKGNKNIVEMRARMSINARSELGSRPGLRFKHMSLIMASGSSISIIEDTLYSLFHDASRIVRSSLQYLCSTDPQILSDQTTCLIVI